MFTRGVAATSDFFIFGGSSVQLNRELRGQGDGKIFICDNNFDVQSELTLKSVQIQEIRIVSEPDFGMSNTNLQSNWT